MQKPGSGAIVISIEKHTLDNRKQHTVEHDGRRLRRDTNVPRLLLELPHGSLLGGLPLVDEPCGDLDADLVDGRAVLLLQDDLGAGGLLEDGDDADAVDVAGLGTGAALGGLPGARGAVLVGVVDLGELDPAGFCVGLSVWGFG